MSKRIGNWQRLILALRKLFFSFEFLAVYSYSLILGGTIEKWMQIHGL